MRRFLPHRVRWPSRFLLGAWMSASVLASSGCETKTTPALPAAQGPVQAVPSKSDALKSELEPQAEDYAEARKKFRTKLVRQGPSPQKWRPLTPPAGVSENEYASGDLTLKAWVSQPVGSDGRKSAAVLFLHGGLAFGESDWNMARPYLDAGFVVMTPMLRGENGQPGHFSMFYDEVDDALAAAEHLSKQAHVDPARIYVAGNSVGGTLALLAAMASDRFRAAVSFSGSPDQLLFAKHAVRQVPFDQADHREFLMRPRWRTPRASNARRGSIMERRSPILRIVVSARRGWPRSKTRGRGGPAGGGPPVIRVHSSGSEHRVLPSASALMAPIRWKSGRDRSWRDFKDVPAVSPDGRLLVAAMSPPDSSNRGTLP